MLGQPKLQGVPTALAQLPDTAEVIFSTDSCWEKPECTESGTLVGPSCLLSPTVGRGVSPSLPLDPGSFCYLL